MEALSAEKSKGESLRAELAARLHLAEERAQEAESAQLWKEPIGSPDLESMLLTPPPSPASPPSLRAFVFDFDHAVQRPPPPPSEGKQGEDSGTSSHAPQTPDTVGSVRIRLLPSLDDSESEGEEKQEEEDADDDVL